MADEKLAEGQLTEEQEWALGADNDGPADVAEVLEVDHGYGD